MLFLVLCFFSLCMHITCTAGTAAAADSGSKNPCLSGCKCYSFRWFALNAFVYLSSFRRFDKSALCMIVTALTHMLPIDSSFRSFVCFCLWWSFITSRNTQKTWRSYLLEACVWGQWLSCIMHSCQIGEKMRGTQMHSTRTTESYSICIRTDKGFYCRNLLLLLCQQCMWCACRERKSRGQEKAKLDAYYMRTENDQNLFKYQKLKKTFLNPTCFRSKKHLRSREQVLVSFICSLTILFVRN